MVILIALRAVKMLTPHVHKLLQESGGSHPAPRSRTSRSCRPRGPQPPPVRSRGVVSEFLMCLAPVCRLLRRVVAERVEQLTGGTRQAPFPTRAPARRISSLSHPRSSPDRGCAPRRTPGNPPGAFEAGVPTIRESLPSSRPQCHINLFGSHIYRFPTETDGSALTIVPVTVITISLLPLMLRYQFLCDILCHRYKREVCRIRESNRISIRTGTERYVALRGVVRRETGSFKVVSSKTRPNSTVTRLTAWRSSTLFLSTKSPLSAVRISSCPESPPPGRLPSRSCVSLVAGRD